MIYTKSLKHDNCKDCISNCEHAGKDREFICKNGISCKKTGDKFANIRKEAIKDFAEKLKDKLQNFIYDNEDDDGKVDSGILYIDLIGVIAENGDIVSVGLIDELIKEYGEMTKQEQIDEIKKALDKEIRCAEYAQEEYADCVKVCLLAESLNIIIKQEQEIEQLSRDYVVKAYDEIRAENAKLKKQVKEVRKETAKEILQILNTINNGAIKLIVKELAERFGVEVEE